MSKQRMKFVGGILLLLAVLAIILLMFFVEAYHLG